MSPWTIAAIAAATILGGCVGVFAWLVHTAIELEADAVDVWCDADLRTLLATPRPAVEVAPLNDAEQSVIARYEFDFRRTTP